MPCTGRWLLAWGHYDVHIYWLALDRLEVDDVVWRGRTYNGRRTIHLRRSIVILGACFAESGECTITCLSGLKDSTGLCMTSIEIQHLCWLFLHTRMYKLSSTCVCMSFLRISGVRWQMMCGSTHQDMWYGMTSCLT